MFSNFSVLTSKAGMFAELQKTLNATTGAIQTTAVGHLHCALIIQNAVTTQKLRCEEEENEEEITDIFIHKLEKLMVSIT